MRLEARIRGGSWSRMWVGKEGLEQGRAVGSGRRERTQGLLKMIRCHWRGGEGRPRTGQASGSRRGWGGGGGGYGQVRGKVLRLF